MTLAEYRELRSQTPAKLAAVTVGLATLYNAAAGWAYEDRYGDIWIVRGGNYARWLRYDEQGREIQPGGKWLDWEVEDVRGREWGPFVALRPATLVELNSGWGYPP